MRLHIVKLAATVPQMPNVGVQRRPKAVRWNNWLESLWFSNAQVATDLARKMVVDLSVPWNCAAPLGDCVVPPRVPGTLTQELATQSREMLQQITAFHTAMGSSS
jgi:hypothetical protein